MSSSEGLRGIEGELAGRLRRLEALSQDALPGFDYDALMRRQASRETRARRLDGLARGTACAVLLSAVLASAWRLMPPAEAPGSAVMAQARTVESSPRLVRADAYLALAALEDHIASIDDALSNARLDAASGPEVVRLERTRAELVDSYTRVRYAEMLSANF